MSVELPSLVVGDTLEFLTTIADYPPSGGWTFKIRLVPISGSATPVLLTATTSGTDYLIQIAPATTAGWTAGEYSWSSWVEKTGARYTVESGLTEILADPSLVLTNDTRSHARKVLTAIEAVLEGRASLDQQEYTIGNRSLKRTPIEDLLVLRDKYRMEVGNEAAQDQIASGGSNPRLIRLNFRRA
jgi:hypothetical protein